VNEAELAIINKGRAAKKKAKRKFPWGGIVRNPNIWMLVFSDFCYGYTLWVYIAWLPTYLVQGRGFTLIKMGIYGSLPLLGGMVGDIVGGLASDYLYKKTDRLKLARCSVTFVAFVGAIVFTLLGAFASDARIAVLGLTAAFFFLETANANLWAIAMDLGGVLYSGTVSGIMNTGFGIAGMVSPIAFGMIVDRTGSWLYPFMVGTALLALGAITILIVNPTKEIKFAEEPAAQQAV
jgi:sugar phosphate permease